MMRFLSLLLFAAIAISGETVKEPELSPAMKQELQARLRRTRIPRIDFKKSTIREATEFLIFAMRGTEADIGLRFSGMSKDGSYSVPTTTTITWSAKNPTFEEVINEICRQGNLQWDLSMYGIRITPSSSRPARR